MTAYRLNEPIFHLLCVEVRYQQKYSPSSILVAVKYASVLRVMVVKRSMTVICFSKDECMHLLYSLVGVEDCYLWFMVNLRDLRVEAPAFPMVTINIVIELY